MHIQEQNKNLHIPVMKEEIINYLNLNYGDIVIDATFGRGGHSLEILQRIGERGFLLAIDQDPDAIEYGKDLLKNSLNVSFYHNNFIRLSEVWEQWKKETFIGKNEIINKKNIAPNAILFDLGISSPQIDNQDRGFSFSKDGPLDMRMNKFAKTTAAELVNTLSKEELKNILKDFGEERYASRIAQAIIGARKNKVILSTRVLANIIKHASPDKDFRKKQDTIVRCFQAIRIAVNDELTALRKSLQQAIEILKSEGILAVISFHSLEDRIVKRFFKTEDKGCTCPANFLLCTCGGKSKINIITKKPIRPSAEELEINPRARSALLRVCQKI